MTGIYGGDGAQLSLQATFPRLRVLELEYGSVLRGLAAPSAPDGRYPPFVSLASGMETLVRGLADALEGRVRSAVSRAAVGLRRTHDGYVVELDDRTTLETEAVILAVPAYVAAQLLTRVDSELGADGKQRREASGLGEIPPIVIDSILKAGIAGGVGAGLTLQHDRATVRQYETVPDEKHAALPELDVVVVLADDARALWNEKNAASRAVVDIFGHLGGDLSQQI